MNRLLASLLATGLCWGCQGPAVVTDELPAPASAPPPMANPDRPARSTSRSNSTKPGTIPGGALLIRTPVAIALDIYRSLIGKQLVLAPKVEMSTAALSLSADRVTKPELAALLEKELRQQAGIVVAPLDETHLSVTVTSASASP